MCKKMIQQLSDLELPELSLLLRQKYSTVIISDLTCKNCEKYVGINKKSLSVHYRTCIKNNNITNAESNSDTPISPDIIDDIKTNTEYKNKTNDDTLKTKNKTKKK